MTSVGVNKFVNITLDPFLLDMHKNTYSVSVFAASRTCSLEPPQRSSFLYETSNLPLVSPELLLNTLTPIAPSTNVVHSNAIWDPTNSTVTLTLNSFLLASIPPSSVYRIQFAVQGQLPASSTETLCVVMTSQAFLSDSLVSTSAACVWASNGVALVLGTRCRFLCEMK